MTTLQYTATTVYRLAMMALAAAAVQTLCRIGATLTEILFTLKAL